MSTTFFLASNETFYPACPACGGKADFSVKPGQDCQEPTCIGYGPDAVKSTPELNVGHLNSYALLRVLGRDSEDLCGEFDAEDLMLRLSMAGYKAPSEVRDTRVTGNVTTFGLTLERITYYCEALGKLAELASRRGEPVLYG